MKYVKGLIMIAALIAIALAIPGYALYRTPGEVKSTSVIEVSPAEVVIVHGPLNMGDMEGTNLGITHNEIQAKVAQGAKQVTIVIDSPGGAYTPAAEMLLGYMDYLNNHGVTLRCVVAGEAISLAAIVLSHCGERYATSASIIMVHAARLSGHMALNQFEAAVLEQMLRNMDDRVWAPFRDLIDDADYWDKNFYSERLIPAVELANLYPNVVTILDSIKVI